jgi:hypothetical protein
MGRGSRWRRRGGRPRREFHFQRGGELLHGILFVVIPLRAPEQQVLVIHLSPLSLLSSISPPTFQSIIAKMNLSHICHLIYSFSPLADV